MNVEKPWQVPSYSRKSEKRMAHKADRHLAKQILKETL